MHELYYFNEFLCRLQVYLYIDDTTSILSLLTLDQGLLLLSFINMASFASVFINCDPFTLKTNRIDEKSNGLIKFNAVNQNIIIKNYFHSFCQEANTKNSMI